MKRRTQSDVKLKGGGEEKYGQKKKRRYVGKEACDDDNKNGGQRDRRRGRRGYGETFATLYYHSPSLPTLYFLSSFIIIRYFVLYSQEIWRGLSLLVWSQAIEQVIFQGSQSLNEVI